MLQSIKIKSMIRWDYYQWFLLGLYFLQEQGKIKLKISVPVLQKIGLWNDSSFLSHCAGKLIRKIYADNDFLIGEANFDHSIVKFAIDSADSPFMYSRKLLNSVDVYFKMQCPKEFSQDGFHLTNNVVIPWTDYAFINDNNIQYIDKKPKGKRKEFKDFLKYADKIYPLMIGPRRLAYGNSFCQLRKGYENIITSQRVDKSNNIMCYFGNAKGPGKSKNVTTDTIDFDWEKDIIGFYTELNHPNEKRAVIRDIIETLPKSSGRIISESNSDNGSNTHPELVIPLPKFSEYVAQFHYNVNISGYRMSIPNRFIDSFSVGTSIVTDDLKVKWYRPFDINEVIEIGELGYEPMEKVEWDDVAYKLEHLPKQNPQIVKKQFDEKWRPDVVAKYIVDTLEKSVKKINDERR